MKYLTFGKSTNQKQSSILVINDQELKSSADGHFFACDNLRRCRARVELRVLALVLLVPCACSE